MEPTTSETKKCRRCNEEKPIGQFGKMFRRRVNVCNGCRKKPEKRAPAEDRPYTVAAEVDGVKVSFTVPAKNVKSASKRAGETMKKFLALDPSEVVLAVQAPPKKVRQRYVSRASRLGEAEGMFQNNDFDGAKGIVEDLKSEMEEWRDNMSGNSMEHLPKYEEVESCVSALEELEGALEELTSGMDNVEFGNVEFPGMY